VIDDYKDKLIELSDVELELLRLRNASSEVSEETAKRDALELANQTRLEKELAELKAKKMAGQQVEVETTQRVDGEIVKVKTLVNVTEQQIKAKEAELLANDKIYQGIIKENDALRERAELIYKQNTLQQETDKLKTTASRTVLDADTFKK
jgi:hypothetical protein